MIKHVTILLFALLLLTSCQDVVETNIIEIEEKVYISGFISPENDSLTVNLSRTLPALGLEFDLNVPNDNSNQFLIRDADVTIRNSTGEAISLPFQESTFNYTESAAGFDVLPGETYSLEVLVNNSLYTSSCTIPPNNLTDIEGQVEVRNGEFGGDDYILNLSFTDIPNSDNFYLLGAFLDNEQEFGFGNTVFFDLDAYQTDILGDGSTISASASFFPARDFEDETLPVLEQDVVLQAINAEQSLYQLLRNQYLNDINEGNPFIELAVEPNNIVGDGGTGLFAGYRYFEKRLPVLE